MPKQNNPDDDVVLRGIVTDLTSAIGHQFVVDCVRAAEGLLSDKDLQEKYELSPVDWGNITKSTALMRAIQAERERRVRTGIAAQESAAKIFAKAPTVLGDILNDRSANPRHRIESARELRQTAIGTAENTADASEKFTIIIDLGADHVERYEKEIRPMKPLLPTNEVKINDDE